MNLLLDFLWNALAWIAGAVFALLAPLVIWAGPVETLRRRFGRRAWIFGPREPGDGSLLEYFDKGRQLTFSGSDDRHFIFPDRALWECIMPDYFRAKHDEVVERCRKQATLSFTGEHAGLDVLFYVSPKGSSGPKVISLGKPLPEFPTQPGTMAG
ncbi:hypothetical protein OJ996_08260 [Luteolibacter sp. GHJ8]|uniref:Uncharacterized protein n=1 Tax=Luteolibacter rhizosphaerae TaxID=2989719 RepID=A0ABT3G159_9BACT|nr:hypothetical protein [Luteolibacter rhizosphaerae]MCW1913564.1 hypothetical protein [Luteolibacter rhizosphaerae]